MKRERLWKRKQQDEFVTFQIKVMGRFCVSALLSAAIVTGFYLFLWKHRLSDVIVSLLERLLNIPHQSALWTYHQYFRGNKKWIFTAAALLVFLLLIWRLFHWMSRYFREIDRGIDSLLADDGAQIRLSPEMLPFERKLNAVKQTLEQRKKETRLAEQRKDELVMYLAHDIRTPLTSVIGYLNLLEEMPDLPAEQRAKHLQITLKKAYRLEQMINEFFEITRYNSRQIRLVKAPVDLGLLLTQLSDEMTPLFSRRGNTVSLELDANLTVPADADKLARVFGNILKNAAAYSEPDTEIKISAGISEGQARILFRDQGAGILPEKLSALFDKFYRLDEARASDTGGSGLGLAIAKEIVLLHGGDIQASSEAGAVTFTVTLPAADTDGKEISTGN